MNNDEKQKRALTQSVAEDMMIDQINFITEEYLQKVRMALLIAFPLRRVDVSYDPNTFKMVWEIKFKIIKTLLKSKQSIIDKIHSLLQDRFQNCVVEVKELRE